MNKVLVLIFSLLSLDPFNTYYVSSTGNDSNPGTQSQPWLTMYRALASTGYSPLIGCGDTLIVVANGYYVSGDANLPTFSSCSLTTTIKSSALNLFVPAGTRTSQVNDNANYGKLMMLNQGILAQPQAYGSGIAPGIGNSSAPGCALGALTTNTLTLSGCGNLGTLKVGYQVGFEINSETSAGAYTLPGGLLNIGQRYYVTSCTGIPCGSSGSVIQVSATPGGAPISGFTCGTAPKPPYPPDSNGCNIWAVLMHVPLQVTVGSPTITSANTISYTAGTPVLFGSAGWQTPGTLPTPLLHDIVYYIENPSGGSFQVSLTPGGPPIVLTSLGTGWFNVSAANNPHDWAFRGLEMTETFNHAQTIYGFLGFGSGQESSYVTGMVHHMEVDRCYIHGQVNDPNPPQRGIYENGQFFYVHDSVLTGFINGEAQAIAGWGSPGPTAIVNNAMSASGEVILYGGSQNSSSSPNQNKIIAGNLMFKPFMWHSNTGAGVPTSTNCLWGNYDPNYVGGEYFENTNTTQWYQCQSNHTWASVSAPIFYGGSLFKDIYEHKSGDNITLTGNILDGNWPQAQGGEILNLSQEYGSGSGIRNDHITLVNNIFSNGYVLAERENLCQITAIVTCPIMSNTHILSNNLFISNPNVCVPPGLGLSCSWGAYQDSWGISDGNQFSYWVMNHMTMYSPDVSYPSGSFGTIYMPAPASNSCAFAFPPTMNQALYQNSILPGDFNGDCAANGSTLWGYFENSLFQNNALHSGTGTGYGTSVIGSTNKWKNTAYPANNSIINYVNATGDQFGDYHLSPSSPYSAQSRNAGPLSTDGTDLGADIDLVNMATSGVATGKPSWDVQSRLATTAGSTKAVFHFQALSTMPWAVTIYNAPARVTANEIAQVLSTATGSVSNGNDIWISITGLTASTEYWYSVTDGTRIMVGTFWTKVAGTGTYQFPFAFSVPRSMAYCDDAAMSLNCANLSSSTNPVILVPSNSIVYASVLSGSTPVAIQALVTP